MSFLRMTNGEMKKSGIPIIINWQVKNVRKTQMIAEEDQTIQEGEVWFVEFPLEENPDVTINRPVVVLDVDELKVLSVKITKHTPRKEDPYDTPIVYWKEAKLNFESTARISKTYSLNKDAFIFKIGTLDTRDMDKVSDLYIKFVKESMRETSSEEIA